MHYIIFSYFILYFVTVCRTYTDWNAYWKRIPWWIYKKSCNVVYVGYLENNVEHQRVIYSLKVVDYDRINEALASHERKFTCLVKEITQNGWSRPLSVSSGWNVPCIEVHRNRALREEVVFLVNTWNDSIKKDIQSFLFNGIMTDELYTTLAWEKKAMNSKYHNITTCPLI